MTHFNRDDTVFSIAQSDLWRILVAESAKGVNAILFGTNDGTLVTNLRRCFPNRSATQNDKRNASLMTKVFALLENPAGVFPNPLDVQGGDFEQLIWAAVRSIPPGKTKSAGEIAREIMAGPSAKESVLKICRDSKLAVVIPTHRVAESDGWGSGFAWGEDKRTTLLEREGHQLLA